MKNFVIGLLVGTFCTCLITLNPGKHEHRAAVAEKISEWTSINTDKLLVDILYTAVSKRKLFVDNYIVCSVSYTYIKGKKVRIGFGMLGKVWITFIRL